MLFYVQYSTLLDCTRINHVTMTQLTKTLLGELTHSYLGNIEMPSALILIAEGTEEMELYVSETLLSVSDISLPKILAQSRMIRSLEPGFLVPQLCSVNKPLQRILHPSRSRAPGVSYFSQTQISIPINQAQSVLFSLTAQISSCATLGQV
jgi:hypothetical protein